MTADDLKVTPVTDLPSNTQLQKILLEEPVNTSLLLHCLAGHWENVTETVPPYVFGGRQGVTLNGGLAEHPPVSRAVTSDM